jgi:hypothetical protein
MLPIFQPKKFRFGVFLVTGEKSVTSFEARISAEYRGKKMFANVVENIRENWRNCSRKVVKLLFGKSGESVREKWRNCSRK